MRESVGLTTIFQMVVAFTFLFAAFLTVAITYNKVYKLKNETMSIIEKYEGVSTKSLGLINTYLKNNGYEAKKACNEDEYGMPSLSSTESLVKAVNNQKYYYCLKSVKEDDEIFYNVKLFFKFNLPFIGELTTFKITGTTKAIKYNKNIPELN